MAPSDHPAGRIRVLLGLILANALLLGAGNILRADEAKTKCDCCRWGSYYYACCTANTCNFGDACCYRDPDCANLNCTKPT